MVEVSSSCNMLSKFRDFRNTQHLKYRMLLWNRSVHLVIRGAKGTSRMEHLRQVWGKDKQGSKGSSQEKTTEQCIRWEVKTHQVSGGRRYTKDYAQVLCGNKPLQLLPELAEMLQRGSTDTPGGCGPHHHQETGVLGGGGKSPNLPCISFLPFLSKLKL